MSSGTEISPALMASRRTGAGHQKAASDSGVVMPRVMGPNPTIAPEETTGSGAVSYTHLTLPTKA